MFIFNRRSIIDFIPQVGEEDEGQPLKAIDKKAPPEEDDIGLGVAQIVITAATPMEEIERPFPGEEESKDESAKTTDAAVEVEKKVADVANDTNENGKKEDTVAEEKTIDDRRAPSEDVEEKSTVDDLPADSAPFPISSSSGSEADSTSGPSTADNSQSLPSRGTVIELQTTDEQPEIIPEKMLIGGRASIPDELQPDQLEKLQNLKESNA